jgi:undecaprenyl-diphosphatase
MLIHAIILGLIQGVTEFLPISSSGHLILIPYLFNFPDQGLAVDAFLHLSTGLAILIYFRKEWWDMFLNFRKDASWRKLLLAGVPAIIVGVVFGDAIESTLRSPWVVVVMLVVVALAMWWVEANYTEVKKVSGKTSSALISIPMSDALIIGLSQCLALIPGTSRSGIMITTAMWRNISRQQAARFAFLVGAPITLGAGLSKLPDLLAAPQVDWGFLIMAATITFVTAIFTMNWLLGFLTRGNLKPFVWYRLALAAVITVILLSKQL